MAMAAPRKRKPTRRESIHEELTVEWLGCEKPLNVNRNVSSAADWVDEILRLQFFADSLDEEEVKRTWKEIAGDFIGAHTDPVSAKEGNLVLRVTQPAMRFHLEQMKPELLRRIRERFGEGKIQSVRFSLG
jgi:predicted nucleic acid-binding Zn ribbon protein